MCVSTFRGLPRCRSSNILYNLIDDLDVNRNCNRKQELQLPQMVPNNEDPKLTAFAVTVDAKEGITTGISAGDRAITLRALAHPKVTVTQSTAFIQLVDN